MARDCPYSVLVLGGDFQDLYQEATELANGSDRWVDVTAEGTVFHFADLYAAGIFAIYAGRVMNLEIQLSWI
jgi:hypothetical protein